MRCLLSLALFLVALWSCQGSVDEPEPGKQDPPAKKSAPVKDAFATTLVCDLTQKKPGTPFYAPQIEVLESAPVQFVLALTREMPDTGTKLLVDSIDIDEKAGRIVAKLREKSEGEAGMAITPVTVRLSFGSLKIRTYRLDLMLQRGEDSKHTSVQQLTLTAK